MPQVEAPSNEHPSPLQTDAEQALSRIHQRQHLTMLVAVVLMVLSAVVSLVLLAFERRELERGSLKHIELVSKILEGQTTRDLNVASN